MLSDTAAQWQTINLCRLNTAQAQVAQSCLLFCLAPQAVEHGFAKVKRLFSYVDHKKNYRLLADGIGCGVGFRIAVFLANCHTCMRGSQVANYVAPPTIEDYCRGGVVPQCMQM